MWLAFSAGVARVGAVSIVAAASALSLGAAEARGGAEPAAAGRARPLLSNTHFTDGLAGWAAHRAQLRVISRAGRVAVRVVPRRRHGRFFIFRSPRPVKSTTAPAVFVARAWVRTSRRQRVCLRVQQVVGGRVARMRRSCLKGARGWRLARVPFHAAGCARGQIGISVVGRGRIAFDVGAITLTEVEARPRWARPSSRCGQRRGVRAVGAAVVARSADRSFLNPFPTGSLWNSPLPANPVVDQASAEKISYWLTQIRWPNMSLRRYATAVAVATPTSPKHTVSCTVYECPNMNQFGPVPIPEGTRPDPSSDGHLAVWDPVNNREWDFWISGCPTACERTASGGSFSTHTMLPWVPFGANAAGWPLLAGIVHPEEIRAGRIDHPLIFGSPNVGVGHVCPANHSDGRNADPRALREGTLLQLDPTLDVDSLGLPAWQRTIARALQRYGMYLADGGGSLSIGGENPINRGDLWAELGLMGDSVLFDSKFPWGRMRVLAAPEPWC
jgi:hypothetical protein